MKPFHAKPVAQTVSPALWDEIEKVKLQMDLAYMNFQNATDPDLIDCYIYESHAACKKYHFLLKLAKLQEK